MLRIIEFWILLRLCAICHKSSYPQDSRRVAQAATPTGGQGHASNLLSINCFSLFYPFLPFAII